MADDGTAREQRRPAHDGKRSDADNLAVSDRK